MKKIAVLTEKEFHKLAKLMVRGISDFGNSLGLAAAKLYRHKKQ